MNNLECERLKASEEKVEYLCDCDNNLTMPSDESMSPDSLKDLFRENTIAIEFNLHSLTVATVRSKYEFK